MLSFDKAIFDLDGTLLDYEQESHEAIKSVCEKYGGKNFTLAIHASIIGTKNEFWSRKLVTELGMTDLLTPEQLVHEYHELMEEACGRMKLLPGAENLLRELKSRKIPIAIATSSTRKMVDKKLSHHPVFAECVDVIVTGDDPAVVNGKPAPDIFLEAARRLGSTDHFKRIVVFEDSPHGVLGGHRAGMQTVAIPDSRFYPFMSEQNRGIFEKNSSLVLKSLDEFSL
jgi:HAD superfamily hydrolase (TIGR01509 family)